jgi:prolyl-tRNA editing enzyme YbaK/EbsC (Cys-tRNA(Pro) deacylase)
VWPDDVESIAAFLRAAGVEGRLEELLPGAHPPAGQTLAVQGFTAGGAVIVALVPSGRTVDEQKLALAAGNLQIRSAPAGVFPFQGARVFVDPSVLPSDVVWLQAGSPRHVLGLSPAQLASITKAETADLLREG